ncbi:hypothetical protein [Streptomyces sp. MH60]|uniref:hypothetical protein n=1 Tax=Streptomyces sp. MH60 TaxID=1940758 RepID=UPI000CEDD235|nr:hypothetical protein [Streptomyces sp. MH60]PPS89497.1 hypothetical protein BZZ08_01643 [Streptomyces sp. MH60]
MDRCHLYLPLIDSSGATYPYAEVTLLDAETGAPVDDPVYLQPTGGAPQKWPLLINPAVINLWTETPMRITVQALLPGGTTFTRTGVDIAPAPVDTVRTTRPVHISSSAGLDSSAMLVVSPGGKAIWQVLDALRYHRHEGDAPESTMLGMTNLTDIYPGQTWLGSAFAGAQGEGATAIARNAVPNGPGAAAVGSGADAAENGVSVGNSSGAGGSSVALGARAKATATDQVALGSDASAAAAPRGAVVIGAGTVAAASDMVTVGGGAHITESGNVALGRGALPDLSWLGSDPYVAVLGKAVIGRFLGARASAVLGGPLSTVGAFGAPGGLQPMLSTAGVSTSTPGRAALLSLMSALDRLGMVYLLDGAVDDELSDWSKAFAHDANMGLETGDDGSKAGDLNRAKRNAIGPGTITYHQTEGIRDFRIRAFTWWQDWNPDNHVNEITAAVSPDNAAWTPVPLAWQPLSPTADDWNQAWAGNARPLPAGMQYLRITLDLNSQAWTPQIGRIVVRPVDPTSVTGFGQGSFGQGPFGG